MRGFFLSAVTRRLFFSVNVATKTHFVLGWSCSNTSLVQSGFLNQMIQTINLVKQVPNKKVREDIVRVFYGLIPCDGKQRSLESILVNENYYRKVAGRVEKTGSKKGALEAL